MTETIIGSVKEAKFYYILCDEDIRQDFVKLIHCKPGLVGKIFTIKLLKHEEVFVLIYEIVVVKVMMMIVLFLAMLIAF